jgi:hypothetical protein
MAEEHEFKVTDRRGFTEDGTSKPAAHAAHAAHVAEDASKAPDTAEAESQSRPPIDFPSYVLGCYTQGVVMLGEAPNPYTNKIEEDVESVRNIIDILSMIEQKTKGNLSGEESQLLESVLYELRMKFMAKTSRIKI